MTTLTFKMPESEARDLRVQARRAGLTVSELVRQRLRGHPKRTPPIRQIRCRRTGAKIFGPAPHLPPLTTETVRAMLDEFP